MRRLVFPLALAALGCPRSTPPPDGGPTRTAPVSSGFAPVAPKPPTLEKTEDGIPIAQAVPRKSEKGGEVRFLEPSAKVEQFPYRSASDGKRIYAALDRDGNGFAVRDGVVHENLLAQFGIKHAGCIAARDGELLVSGVVDDRQNVILVHADGSVTKKVLEAKYGHSDDCRAWLGPSDTWTVSSFGLVTWDGTQLSVDDRYGGRMTLGSPTSPRYCFVSCNQNEEATNPPLTKEIRTALGNSIGFLDWAGYENWIGVAHKGRALRSSDATGVEKIDGVPESKILNGSYNSVFTANGDLVIALDYRFARYVVWPAGAKALSPIRTLVPGDTLAAASPTFIVRGIGAGAPPATISAVLLGKDVGYGANGGTYGYSDVRRGPDAHKAAFARAQAVLPAKKPVVADEAVVDLDCGSYVRSPVGYEGMRMHDWTPPVLPSLSPLAVTKQAPCVALEQVAALPGEPSLLFGLTAQKELWAAWLPPPLPLPTGVSHFHPPPGGSAPPPPVQNPKAGTGWFAVGKADALTGIEGVAAPGVDTVLPHGSWGSGGAAIVRVGATEILVHRGGAATLPEHVEPMAIATEGAFHAWGAQGEQLVDCAAPAGCRILDPAVGTKITGVVPRSASSLILGFADGRVGVYDVPAAGGKLIPQHALVPALEAAFTKRPKE